MTNADIMIALCIA